MAKAFKRYKKGQYETYLAPALMKQATNITMVTADGIFFDGTSYSKMYHFTLDSDKKIPFEGIFALLRKENARFQCRKIYLADRAENYLVLFCPGSGKGDIDREVFDFFHKLEQKIREQIELAGLSVELSAVDADRRLHMLHVMLNDRGQRAESYLTDSRWLEDLKMRHINWTRSLAHFQTENEFQKLYLICTISPDCENLYASIESVPGIRMAAAEFSAISDSTVIRHMESLYLDVEAVYSKLRKKNPALYNAYVNGAQVDTYGYTFAGLLVLLASPTEDMLRDSEYLLMQAAKNGAYQVVSLYGSQRENYCSILPTASYPIQTRIHPTDEAIEFFPYIYEIENPMEQKRKEDADGIKTAAVSVPEKAGYAAPLCSGQRTGTD